MKVDQHVWVSKSYCVDDQDISMGRTLRPNLSQITLCGIVTPKKTHKNEQIFGCQKEVFKSSHPMYIV